MEKKAVLVGIFPQGKEEECLKSLDELERLADTAGATTFARLTQMKNVPDAATCIGSGKLEELKELCQNNEIDIIIFDSELSPAQIKNIESVAECDVVDRSMLILDIFALHAVSAEGKIQVELAQLKYTAPRLIGKGKDMSRLGGGIGTRGPGESKLEIDRRRLASRISFLQGELNELEKNRQIMRAQRERSNIPKACIVGYTNAGKSSLLNMLTNAGILAEDKLFATLDPTTRKFSLPSGESVLLTDTVGFIRRLPHHLIKAFRSTLDEAACADILMIIVDASDPEHPAQLEVTENLLAELGAGGKPCLIVYNKCDLPARDEIPLPAMESSDGQRRTVFISALTGRGLDKLGEQLESLVNAGKKRVKFIIPNASAGALNTLYKNASVEDVDYGAENITVIATVDAKIRGMLSAYDGGEVR